MVKEITIGKNIKKHRTKQGFSQVDFVKNSGVRYTALTKIGSGVIKKPSVIITAHIVRTLDISIEDLIQ